MVCREGALESPGRLLGIESHTSPLMYLGGNHHSAGTLT